MNSEADQSSLTITNIPETGSGNLDTFFICYGEPRVAPRLRSEHSLVIFDPPDQKFCRRQTTKEWWSLAGSNR